MLYMNATGHIERKPAAPGTNWARPFNLFAMGLSGWMFCGDYPTESGARSAAKRRGITLPVNPSRSRSAARRRRLLAL